MFGTVGEVVHKTAELVQASHCPRIEHRGQTVAKQSLKQTHFVLRGKQPQALQSLVADAALRRGDRAQERRVVIVVDPQAQPSAEIANLRTVKKTLTARYLVRNLRFAKSLFQDARLVVGAVEHCEVLQLFVLRARSGFYAIAQRLNARHHAFGLVLFVVGVDHAHRFSFAQF